MYLLILTRQEFILLERSILINIDDHAYAITI